MNKLSGIYFHIPFCRKRCLYCDFYSTEISSENVKERYGEALFDELKRRIRELDGTQKVSVYFGGGSPTSMNGEFFLDFAECAEELGCDLSSMEVTAEVNPADIDEAWIKNLRECGINRVSIGVQAFDDAVLSEMGRRVNISDMQKNIPVFARYFDNISCDLIYGLGKGRDLRYELESLFGLADFKHISAYQYSRPERKNAPLLLDEDETFAQESMIREFLGNRGFSRYEISNYSLPGFESRHNMLYWSFGSWLGIGAGAASFIERTRTHSRYCDNVEAFIKGEGLSSYKSDPREQIEEFIMMGLRTKNGIDLDDFNELFGKKFSECIGGKTISRMVDEGLLEFCENSSILKCTEKGSEFLNVVLVNIFENIR